MFIFRKSTTPNPTDSTEDLEKIDSIETSETDDNSNVDNITENLESTNIDENDSSKGSDDVDESASEHSEYESSNESDYDDSSNYVEDSEVYVITVNDVPKCYTYSLHNARTTMWKVARIIRNKNPLYKTIISEITLDNIEIVGHYNFAIVSVDQIVSSLRIHKIGRLLPIKKD